MHIFYTPHIETTLELPEEESRHCVRVLRLAEGTEIRLMDGKGTFYRAAITLAHPKHCTVSIIEKILLPQPVELHPAHSHSTHQKHRPHRMVCRKMHRNRHRRHYPAALPLLGTQRSQKRTHRKNHHISSQAIPQSHVARTVRNHRFQKFITQPFDGDKYIAHCYDQENKILLKNACKPGTNTLVLIGPEGDFSTEEVEAAIAGGFIPVSLGNSRLRTETAGVVACHTLQLINE